MKLKTLLIASLVGLNLVGVAHADVAPPTKYVTLFFEQSEQPINYPVKYEIRCYGQTYDYQFNLNEEIIEISDYAGTCESYGCQFAAPTLFDVYRTEERYCDVSGEFNGQTFTVKDFLGPDMTGLNCQRADYDIYGDSYYKKTSAYDQCLADIRLEYYPDGENFICHQSMVLSKTGDCMGYGHMIINDQCFEFSDETKACIDKKYQKEEKCWDLLEDVSDKLVLDESGYAFDELCNISIDLFGENSVVIDNHSDDDQHQTELKSVSWLDKVFNFFHCAWRGLFGQPC